MATYLHLLLYAILAELIRRIVQILICAYTGPLSKIPGPAINKLTSVTWRLRLASGDFYYELPKLFEKYGDTVRVGELSLLIFTVLSCTLRVVGRADVFFFFFDKSGPAIVLVKGRDTAQQLLVDNVLKKSPIYDGFRPDPHHADLFTERDKDAHKHRVSIYFSYAQHIIAYIPLLRIPHLRTD